jgi:hypothetical protein
VTRPLSRVAVATAVLVLVGFAVFVVVLVVQASTTDEIYWSRVTWVFASVEAIAFGAAGALFGSSIQKDRADRAEADARDNAQAAASGRALAEVIKAEDPGLPVGQTALEPLGAGAPRAAAAGVAARHAEVARKLFP